MPGGRGHKATPADIVANGEFATRLRAMLQTRGWTVPDLNVAIGKARKYSPPHVWLAGKGQPAGANRAKVLQLLAGTEGGDKTVVPVVAAAGRPAATVRAPEALAFTVGTDGTARIRLDVILPVERAMPLLRLLLDAHVVDTAS